MTCYIYPQNESENVYHNLDIIEQDQLTDIRQLNDVSKNISVAFMVTNKDFVVIKKIEKPQPEEVNKWGHIYKHPNIVGFLGISIKGLFLIMPFAKDGNLRNYIENNTLSFNRKIEIAMNITNAVSYLHKNDVVHENLNPRNILVFNGIAKVTNLPNDLYIKNKDLYINDSLFDNIGYIDPSSILNRNYKKNKNMDIYSLGTLLWEIMSEKIPYSEDQNDGILQLILKIKSGYREVDVISNPDYVNLYKSCWDGNNLIRPKIDDVYNQLLSIMKLGN